MLRHELLLVMVAIGSLFLITGNSNSVLADKMKCEDDFGKMSWGSSSHDDNNPSSSKGKKLIKSGAGVCEIAKKCDHMQIDIAIDDKKDLHKTAMYKNASEDVQEELDEYVKHGNGHDDPNLVCYEVEDSLERD